MLRLYIKIYKEDYKVKKILNKKYINKEIKYLVKWKNYKEVNNIQELIKYLKNS